MQQVKQSLSRLQQKLQQSSPLPTLIRGASVAIVTQLLSAGTIYLVQIGLARWMGVTEYGTYELIIAFATALSILMGLGLSGAVLRFIPSYVVQQDWGLLRGLIWGGWRSMLLFTVSTAAIGSAIVGFIYRSQPLHLLLPWLVGLWLIPLLTLTKLQLETIRGMKRIGLAYAPFFVLYPLLVGVVTWIWVQFTSLNSVPALALTGVVLGVILLAQRLIFTQTLPIEVRHATPQYHYRQWLATALPMLLFDGSYIVLNQTDTLMIGWLIDTQSVGIYSAALKTASWVNFILVAVNAIAAPLFASLYAQGDRKALQRLVSTIARWMFWPALMMAIGLVVFAEPVLRLFGPEFVVAKGPMMALILGQLVNVGAGSVGYLMLTTGHQNQSAVVMVCAALTNIGLNAIGIPWLGVLGAAIATAGSMMMWNIWLNRLVVKYLGVDPSIWAAWRMRT